MLDPLTIAKYDSLNLQEGTDVYMHYWQTHPSEQEALLSYQEYKKQRRNDMTEDFKPLENTPATKTPVNALVGNSRDSLPMLVLPEIALGQDTNVPEIAAAVAKDLVAVAVLQDPDYNHAIKIAANYTPQLQKLPDIETHEQHAQCAEVKSFLKSELDRLEAFRQNRVGIMTKYVRSANAAVKAVAGMLSDIYNRVDAKTRKFEGSDIVQQADTTALQTEGLQSIPSTDVPPAQQVAGAESTEIQTPEPAAQTTLKREFTITDPVKLLKAITSKDARKAKFTTTMIVFNTDEVQKVIGDPGRRRVKVPGVTYWDSDTATGEKIGDDVKG